MPGQGSAYVGLFIICYLGSADIVARRTTNSLRLHVGIYEVSEGSHEIMRCRAWLALLNNEQRSQPSWSDRSKHQRPRRVGCSSQTSLNGVRWRALWRKATIGTVREIMHRMIKRFTQPGVLAATTRKIAKAEGESGSIGTA